MTTTYHRARLVQSNLIHKGGKNYYYLTDGVWIDLIEVAGVLYNAKEYLARLRK